MFDSKDELPYTKFGVALWGIGGWCVTFFSTIAQGWDDRSVWLASLLVGAAVAIMYIAVQLYRHRQRGCVSNVTGH